MTMMTVSVAAMPGRSKRCASDEPATLAPGLARMAALTWSASSERLARACEKGMTSLAEIDMASLTVISCTILYIIQCIKE